MIKFSYKRVSRVTRRFSKMDLQTFAQGVWSVCPTHSYKKIEKRRVWKIFTNKLLVIFRVVKVFITNDIDESDSRDKKRQIWKKPTS